MLGKKINRKDIFKCSTTITAIHPLYTWYDTESTHRSGQQWPWAAWWEWRVYLALGGGRGPEPLDWTRTGLWCWASAHAPACSLESSPPWSAQGMLLHPPVHGRGWRNAPGGCPGRENAGFVRTGSRESKSNRGEETEKETNVLRQSRDMLQGECNNNMDTCGMHVCTDVYRQTGWAKKTFTVLAVLVWRDPAFAHLCVHGWHRLDFKVEKSLVTLHPLDWRDLKRKFLQDTGNINMTFVPVFAILLS